MLLANRYFDESFEIMHGVCACDHLKDGIFPHDSNGHP